MRKIISIFILIVLFSSCKNEEITHNFKITDQGWGKFQNLTFSLDKLTPNKPYSVQMTLEINQSFSEEMFIFQILIESDEGESWNQIFSFPVKDKNGDFLITPQGGKIVYNFVLYKAKYFNEKGKYSFEIVNLNPKIRTSGIEKLSITFRR